MKYLSAQIGRDVFADLHGFLWADHKWTHPIPEIAELETFEYLVHLDHPELLMVGIGNVGSYV